jgi:hypothetical protein
MFMIVMSVNPWATTPAGANPVVTDSRYTGNPDDDGAGPHLGLNTTTEFWSLGCQRGSASQNGAIILDFGDPSYVSGQGYGAVAPGYPNPFWTTSAIQTRAQEFIRGFYNCGTASAFATVIIGVTNVGTWTGDTAHAQAWSSLVTNVQNYISSNGYGTRASVAAGFDAELNWNNKTTTRAWVSAYAGAYTGRLYDFGDAAGCPSSYSYNGSAYVTGQTSSAGSCNNGWSQDDVRYVSWGAPPAWPLPEIYTELGGATFSAQAVQWERVSNYSRLAYGSPLQISGVLTQYGACVEVGSPCTGVKNTPNAGYDQLWNALQYLDSGVVAFTPGWLSDIHWWQ